MQPLPTLVFLYDESAKIIWLSDTVPPHTPAEFIGHLAWEQLQDHDDKELQAAFAKCAAGHSPQILDVDSGSVGWWRIWLYRARVQAGRVRFVSYAQPFPLGIRNLTDRERQVCAALARGGRSKQAARELGLSVSTVDTHRQRISVKLGITPDTLVAWCGFHAQWLGAEFK